MRTVSSSEMLLTIQRYVSRHIAQDGNLRRLYVFVLKLWTEKFSKTTHLNAIISEPIKKIGLALLNFAILTQFQENFATVRRGVNVEISKVLCHWIDGALSTVLRPASLLSLPCCEEGCVRGLEILGKPLEAYRVPWILYRRWQLKGLRGRKNTSTDKKFCAPF